jgi:hypothetical protein
MKCGVKKRYSATYDSERNMPTNIADDNATYFGFENIIFKACLCNLA